MRFVNHSFGDGPQVVSQISDLLGTILGVLRLGKVIRIVLACVLTLFSRVLTLFSCCCGCCSRKGPGRPFKCSLQANAPKQRSMSDFIKPIVPVLALAGAAAVANAPALSQAPPSSAGPVLLGALATLNIILAVQPFADPAAHINAVRATQLDQIQRMLGGRLVLAKPTKAATNTAGGAQYIYLCAGSCQSIL